MQSIPPKKFLTADTSDDGGVNWTSQVANQGTPIAVDVIDANNVWIGCLDGHFLYTTSGGIDIPVTPSLRVTTASRVTLSFGAALRISGQLTDGATGVPSRQLRLEASVGQSAFADTGVRTSTDAKGGFTFTVKPTVKTTYRVAFAGVPADLYLQAKGTAVAVTPKAYLTCPTAPARVKQKVSFVSQAYLKPRHTSGSHPVSIRCWRHERQSNGRYKWVYRRSFTARASNYGGGSRITASVRLPYAGRWYIRAYHSDAGHAPTYGAPRYLTVRS